MRVRYKKCVFFLRAKVVVGILENEKLLGVAPAPLPSRPRRASFVSLRSPWTRADACRVPCTVVSGLRTGATSFGLRSDVGDVARCSYEVSRLCSRARCVRCDRCGVRGVSTKHKV